MCHVPTRKGRHSNHHAPLSGSQFPKTHPKTRKAYGILARLKNGTLPNLLSAFNLRIYSNSWNSTKRNSTEFHLKHGLPFAQGKQFIIFTHNPISGHHQQTYNT